ncbi:MAG: exo-beta-N-acetylmuramidase NamZ family protein [Candidatus Amoebophilus sp.]
MTFRWLLILSFILLSYPFTITAHAASQVITGAEQLEAYLPKLRNKNIAVIANAASQVKGVHLVDILLKHGVIIKKILAPEHGFRGQKDAGEFDEDTIDTRTGIEIVSLYKQQSKRLTPSMLEGIDLVIFDIQDVGVRFFTYISTLHYVMEACAFCSKPLLLLDRPNPNAHYVDGPVLEKHVQSFIGMHPIPIVYGLTIGELASMINEEGWLKDGLKCNLKIIPLKNYTHQTSYELPHKPSPNLANRQAVALYPSLGLFEGTIMSVGRGTDYPFQVIGYPDKTWGNFNFIPVSIPSMATSPKYQDKQCYGLDFREVIPSSFINLAYLLHFYKLAKEQNISLFEKSFDLHVGNTTLRQQIEAGLSEKEIRASWQADLNRYKILRKNYLLYPE